MKMYDLIHKKKNKERLTAQEIEFIVSNFTKGVIPDYQMSAFLMAVCFNGMDHQETADLTVAMANSGDLLDLSRIDGVKVDKHSTGGVGDKTSLVLGPMVASLGIPVAKMSGRGLGHTGGTIDKLESFPGFTTTISTEQFISNVNRIKMAIVGQTANLAPADKKIYALRDVTATVDNLSLIASSIMSKKIASGSDVIVLDVKTGSGAFMKSLEDSIALAKEMVQIGSLSGRKTYAVITDMDQPLGSAVGNTLEVIEAIDTLKGEGPKDLLAVSIILAAFMLVGAERAENVEEAKKLLYQTIENGSALDKMAQFVAAQGGDSDYVYHTDRFAKAALKEPVTAGTEGFITAIHTEEVGMTSLILGGGRETKESVIDLSVGIEIQKKMGEHVNKGDVLAVLHANDRKKLTEAKERLQRAYSIGAEKPANHKNVYAIVTKDGVEML